MVRGHGRCAIGEEFLYCVKAAGFADGSAASGRACGLRPVPPCAAPQQRQRVADPGRSLSIVLQAAGDEGEGADVPKPASDRCGVSVTGPLVAPRNMVLNIYAAQAILMMC